MTTSTIIYAPLSSDDEEIRILELLPGTGQDEIRCKLQTVSLKCYSWTRLLLKNFLLTKNAGPYSMPYATLEEYDEARRQHHLPARTCSSQIYAFRRADRQNSEETELDIPSCNTIPCCCFQALSYTWGPYTQSRTMTLQGQPGIKITDNLYAALLRLRRPAEVRRLWVDAVCIDQADLNERAAQVRLMATLYSTAPEVLVWLGEVDITHTWARVHAEYSRVFLDRDTAAEGHDEPRWQMLNLAIGEIMSHATATPLWFFRSWIVQEVVNAKYAPKIQLGSFEGSWLDLMRAFLRRPYKPPGIMEAGRLVRNLDAMRPGKAEDRSLLDFIGDTNKLDCTDPRDRVFCLLGMVRRREAVLVDVDYSDETTEGVIYTQATYAAIEGRGDLRAFAFLAAQDRRTEGMPSWAVDFAWKTDFELGTLSGPVRWTKEKAQVEVTVALEDGRLRVRGLVFDVVERVVSLESDTAQPASKFALMKLSQTCADDIVNALEALPNRDPYKALQHTTPTQNLYDGLEGDRDPPDWTNLLTCAHRNLPSKAPDQSLRYDRHRREDLFAAWDRAVSLRQRCSVPDYRDPEERDYTLGLNMPLSTSGVKDYTFITTRCGFIGIGLRDVDAGDVVALLYGSRFPAVLRLVGDAVYAFKGLALVNGVSYGELGDVVPGLELREEDFWLI
ncbi:Heterokaryon incompatibility protein 6, OR allele [Fulvia fulva]|uniref:Heterokaryon incompatibility protein 6, OR allele n=1 Tax=Passalora fulva TaxID=5499 RepID=A0A9Q8PKC9_PASFU|nr:Heterokaryon incompatibility protein 6, OR allele [Fulvia fulva]KAK4612070.1 Heterokaryon incompatibility protein 6, OR allele [Fulvia fulva]KAK4613051.1 Heterokaryon incompatibility protein 6, OR allele [Fulvia fulva]UJO23974.1 Heterokaryon incompatibility protein 6, OR allele [Fulvia fulva]WPV20841.1 Heterokaryon incompatibility protein 6, OR allele [Fulvia fulva]WPV36073.1 Heterokaryon incompatibility protein 6, OR allele [Fulvia fulva]